MQTSNPTMQDFLGIKFLSSDHKKLIASMQVTERSSQVHGLLNGGASLALCEICAGTMSLKLLEGTEYTALGAQVSANHLRSAPLGAIVRCIVTPLKTGSRLHVMDCKVVNEKDEVLCSATVTNMVVPRAQIAGGKKTADSTAAEYTSAPAGGLCHE